MKQAFRQQVRLYSQRSKRHEPLRVLFCGSDAFSIYSLQAINTLRLARPEVIASIDVLCRPDKRVGRGNKLLHAVPIKAASQDLKLPLQQLDTFKDWQPLEQQPDLIITASFGLLVPSRVLDQCQYGGLNVHPSLLPQFRGAAPIQHAIMRHASVTGVSVQTMHPTKFDHGVVLAQERCDVGAMPSPPTTSDLIHKLGPVGGRLLVDTISSGAFMQPQSAVGTESTSQLFKAPKIQAADRLLDWQTWTSDDIMAHDRALDNLWDKTMVAQCAGTNATSKRIVYHGPWTIAGKSDVAAGAAVLLIGHPDTQNIAFSTVDGLLIMPTSATIESESRDRGLASLRKMLLLRDSN